MACPVQPKGGYALPAPGTVPWSGSHPTTGDRPPRLESFLAGTGESGPLPPGPVGVARPEQAGWLEKPAVRMLGYCHKRFFKLTYDGLFYWTTEDTSGPPKGSYDLSDLVGCTARGVQVELAFVHASGGGAEPLKAASEEEAQAWAAALQRRTRDLQQGPVLLQVTDQTCAQTVRLRVNHSDRLEVVMAKIASCEDFEYGHRGICRRLFAPTGTELFSLHDVCKHCPGQGTDEEPYALIASDGLDFQFKYEDHQDLRFSDVLFKPLARYFSGRGFKTPMVKEPPQPFALGYTGNLKDVGSDMWQAFVRLEKRYGSVFKLRIFNDVIYVVADPETVDKVMEVADKRIPAASFGMKTLACKGVFIADGQQWQFARHVFEKALTPETIDQLLPQFVDKILKLQAVCLDAAAASGEAVNTQAWVERLTYDVICTVGFGHNPDELGAEDGHASPFIQVFDDVLETSINSALYGAFDFFGTKKREYHEQNKKLDNFLDEIIAEARADPSGTSLLHLLLAARCPLTQRGLEDSELRDQLITLLVAGHKTTTLLATWSLYHIANSADACENLVDELKSVFGADMDRPPEPKDLKRLKYMDKVLWETLRINTPVQVAQRGLTQPIELGGPNGYTLLPGGHRGRGNSWVAIHLVGIAHSEEYWGADPHEFRPERFDDTSKFHPRQFVPFGGGRRLCLGNLFALGQVKAFLAILLRKYQVRTVQSKPVVIDPTDLATPLSVEKDKDRGGVWLRFFPRKNWGDAPQAYVLQPSPTKEMHRRLTAPAIRGTGKVHVVWGGEFGTSKRAAEGLRAAAEKAGFDASLQDCAEVDVAKLPKDATLVVVMATYNGHPPTNAAAFVKALGGAKLSGLHFAVLALGNSNWVSTYAKVGRETDRLLQEAGATRVFPLEVADKNGDFDEDVLSWRHQLLVQLGGSDFEAPPDRAEAPPPYASLGGDPTVPGTAEQLARCDRNREAWLQHLGLRPAEVTKNVALVDAKDRQVHDLGIGIEQPFEPGDHLLVQAALAPALVLRVCQRLGVNPLGVVVPRSSRPEEERDQRVTFAIEREVRVGDMVALYCDVEKVPTRESLAMLAESAKNTFEKDAITSLTEQAAYQQWAKRGISLMQCLERWPSVNLGLARFVECCQHIEPRLYSIASSPRRKGCDLCVAVLQYTTQDGEKTLEHRGLCSSQLGQLEVGQTVLCSVKPAPHMRLPGPDTKMYCVCGGTGLAPFLGFLEERWALTKCGQEVAKTCLYFGCRNDEDFLHRERLQSWVHDGILDLTPCFSRQGRKEYVQHALLRDAEALAADLRAGASLYLCGAAGTLARGVLDALVQVLGGGERGDRELQELQDRGQVVLDVWG